MGARCFLLEPTETAQVSLRRYSNGYLKDETGRWISEEIPGRTDGATQPVKDSTIPKCPGSWGYHNVSVVIDPEAPFLRKDGVTGESRDDVPHYDPRWPVRCDQCPYEFRENDEWQVNWDRHFQNAEGQKWTLHDAPPGAMWFAEWWVRNRTGELNEHGTAPGGLPLQVNPSRGPLVVKCPGGHDWMPESRANNCTLSDDNEHSCWVIEGTIPNLSVSKNGKTCSAGAGSIQTGNWHGFLRNGELDE